MKLKYIFCILVILSLFSGVQALTWSSSNGCWTATDGLYTIRMWNASGTTSYTIPYGVSEVSYSVVGGGGGGSRGGGGGGGVLNASGFSVTPLSVVKVQVGAGGTGADANVGTSANAGTSSIFSTLTALGGGYGGGTEKGGYGGSGGGGGNDGASTVVGGDGAQGKGGGGNGGFTTSPYAAGGGGGYSTNGTSATSESAAGNGGNGIILSHGSLTLQVSGGGGGGVRAGGTPGTAGAYGGTAGTTSTNADDCAANSGGGGGASGTGIGGDGGSGIVVIRYLTPPLSPIASFTQNKTSGQSPLAVLFTDTSTVRPKVWNWSVNSTDWSTRTWYNYTVSTNLEQLFVTPGIYNITLSVQNITESETISTVQHDVLVNTTLAADFVGSPLYGFAPQDVAFVDYSTGADITAWNWSFGDGSLSTLKNPTHTYNTQGKFDIHLEVTGADGVASKTELDYVMIDYKTFSNFTANNTAPIAYESVVLFTPDVLGSADRYLWQWGADEGSFLSYNTTETHIYTSTGAKDVTLTAYRSDNLSVTNTTTRVAYITPVLNASYVKADFVGTPTSGSVGLAVVFTDLSAFGSTAAVSGRSYNWSFGDDSYSTTPYSDVVGDVTHVYPALGTYTVTLKVNNTLANSTETKINYITIATSALTTWYTQRIVKISPVDSNGIPINHANVSMNFRGSSLPNTDVQWIQSAFGVSQQVAEEMQDSTYTMSSFSGEAGSVSFMVFPGFLYDVRIQNTTTALDFKTSLHPSDAEYTIYCPTTTTTLNKGNVTYNQIANTSLFVTEPNMSYVTINFVYQDMSALTSSVIWNVTYRGNGTVMHSNTYAYPGIGIIRDNYTVKNVRGQEWWFGYNATRSARS